MTVIVETPEGIKAGSTIREISFHTELRILPQQGGTYYAVSKGEAVAIDLGDKGKVFAIMRGGWGGVDYGHRIALDALRLDIGQNANTKAVLKPEQYPTFIWFRDIRDPTSAVNAFHVEFYDTRDQKQNFLGRKSRIENRFEELFGNGVRIKEVTVEATDAPVTWGVSEVLPSFGVETRFSEWRKSLRFDDPLSFDRTDFIRGEQ